LPTGGKEESVFFFEKKTKNFHNFRIAVARCLDAKLIKVFCFFFSKKKRLLPYLFPQSKPCTSRKPPAAPS
jgi:hypothetical protein